MKRVLDQVNSEVKAPTDARANGRKNLCVLFKFSPTELTNLWTTAQKSIDIKYRSGCVRPRTEPCWNWTGSTQNGYPSISQDHGKSKVKVHILACWSVSGQLPKPNEMTMHLCHNKVCINPKHLAIGTIEMNNSAKGCLCCFKTPEGIVYDLCNHEPKCIASDLDNNGNFVPSVIQ